MKVAFVFGVALEKYKNEYYSINLDSKLMQERYLGIFDDMVVVCRYKDSNSNPDGRMVKVNGDRIVTKCIKHQPGLKRALYLRTEQQFIEEAIKDCDYVICRGIWGAKACRKLGKNYMIELVNCAWDAYWNHGAAGKIAAPYMYFKTKYEVAKAGRVLYVTNRFLQSRYPTSGISIGVSDVALNKIDDAILQKRLKKIQSYTEGQKLILGTTAAIDVPYKGQRFVIQALGILKKKGITNFEYQVVGNGSPDALLQCAKEAQVEDQVRILGGFPHDKVFEWLDTIDVYIQPSLQEGLPRAMVEAMSCGLPCIGAPTGGIPELIDPEFVCKNKIRLQEKIADLLLSLNQEKMLKEAEKNFASAKNYDADFLNKKRRSFLEALRDGG